MSLQNTMQVFIAIIWNVSKRNASCTVQKVIKRNITTSVHLRIFKKLGRYRIVIMLRGYSDFSVCMLISHTIVKTLSLGVNKFPYGTLRRFLSNNLFRLILGPRPRSSIVITLLSEALVLVPFTISAPPGMGQSCRPDKLLRQPLLPQFFGVAYQSLLRMPHCTSRSSFHAWKIPRPSNYFQELCMVLEIRNKVLHGKQN